MKSLKKIAVFLCVNVSLAFCEIPFEQALGLYEGTKKDFQAISPFWSMVAVHGKMFEKILFFGPSMKYTFIKDRPLNKDDSTFDNKNDAIAKLLVWLFPSPDGQTLVANQRNKDPLGNLSKDLKKLNDIIMVLLDPSKEDKKKVEEIKQIFEALIDKKSSNKPTQKKANSDFSNLLVNAYKEQELLANPNNPLDQLYPENIVTLSLLSYYVKVADTADGFKDFFFMEKDYRVSQFNNHQYEKIIKNTEDKKELKEIITDTSNSELSFLLWKGYEAYERKFITPINYTQSSYLGKTFPNCGETFLRNIFYFFLSRPNKGINDERIEELKKKLDPKNSTKEVHQQFQTLLDYFKKYPSLSSKQEAHDDWNNVVSKLNQNNELTANDVQYGRPEKPYTYEIKSDFSMLHIRGILNMLNVIAKILPDKKFSETWPDDQKERLVMAGKKMDRLCELLSTDELPLTWEVSGQKNKLISTDFPYLLMKAAGEPTLELQFKDGHFQVEQKTSNKQDWRGLFNKIDYFGNEWLSGLYRKINKDLLKNPSKDRENSDLDLIYGTNLNSLAGLKNALAFIFTHNLKKFDSLIPFWTQKVISVDDGYAIKNFSKFLYEYKLKNKIDIEKLLNPALYEKTTDYINKIEKDPLPHLNEWCESNTELFNTFIEKTREIESKDQEGNTLLAQAIVKDFTLLATKLIEIGANVNANNINGQSVLYQSLKRKNYSIANQILDMGGTLSKSDRQDSFFLDLNLVKEILDKTLILKVLDLEGWTPANLNLKDVSNKTMLYYVTQNHEIKLMYKLLEKGADVNNLGSVNDKHETPLLVAVLMNDLEFFDYLIQKGAIFDLFEKSRLLKAAISDFYNADGPVLEETLAIMNKIFEKCDESETSQIVNSQDSEGKTALHLCLDHKKPNKKLLNFLLEKGANVTVQDNTGQTPFDVLSYTNTSDKIKSALMKELLLKIQDTDIDKKDEMGGTLLFRAVENKYPLEVIEEILKKGADVNAVDSMGRTPLHITALKLNQELASLLLNYGANPDLTDDKQKKPLELADDAYSQNKDAAYFLKNYHDIFTRHLEKKEFNKN